MQSLSVSYYSAFLSINYFLKSDPQKINKKIINKSRTCSHLTAKIGREKERLREMKRFYGTPDPHNLSWCEAGLGWGGGGGGGEGLQERGDTKEKTHSNVQTCVCVHQLCVLCVVLGNREVFPHILPALLSLVFMVRSCIKHSTTLYTLSFMRWWHSQLQTKLFNEHTSLGNKAMLQATMKKTVQ